jgi:hypothetical protein
MRVASGAASSHVDDAIARPYPATVSKKKDKPGGDE